MTNLPALRTRIARLAGLPAMAATALALVLAAPAYAQDPAPAPAESPVIATVNGEAITEADLEAAAADFGEELSSIPAEQQREALLQAVIDMQLMATEAVAGNLDEDPVFLMRMEQIRDRELRNIYFERIIDATITEEEVRARYELEVAQLELPEEYRASHILVATAQEALEITRLLEEGGDFAELARTRSIDTGTAPEGGDLGFYALGDLVPEFEEAALALEVGATTIAPVESQFGWHIIRLEERRTQPPPAFEAVAGQVRQLVLRDAYIAALTELRDEATIEIVPVAGAEPAVDPAVPAPVDPAAPPADPAAPPATPAPADPVAPALPPAQ